MAALTVTSTPVTLEAGTSYEVLLVNSGSVDVYVSRGTQSFRLKPGASKTVQPEGAAVTARVMGNDNGQVTTTVTTASNPEVPASASLVSLASKGAASGVASLNGSGQVPLSQLRLQSKSARRQASANYVSMGSSPTFTIGGTIAGSTTTISATVAGTATTVSASNQITASTLTVGKTGDVIAVQPGFPIGTKIVAGGGTSTVTLDQPATASGTSIGTAIADATVPWRYIGYDVVAKGLGPAIVSGYDPTVAGASPARSSTGQGSWGMEFNFDGQKLLINYDYQGTMTGRVWVNEQVSADFTVGSGSALLVDLGAKPTVPQRWAIETDTKLCLKSLTYAVTDTLLPPEPASGPTLAVVGDSFGIGVGVINTSTGSTSNYIAQLARTLGITNWRNYALGATGLTGTNNYGQRINDVVSYAPDLLLVQGSINDSGQTAGTIQAALTSYLQALQVALPSTQIAVCSPMPVLTPDTPTTTVGQGMAAACATCNVPYLDFITNTKLRLGTGTGQVGATNGTGNADFYNSSIRAAHPNFGGSYVRAHALAPLLSAVWNLGV